ncbi:hypothetical protein WDZ92_28380 [Nostoc sp. NIES-2111]
MPVEEKERLFHTQLVKYGVEYTTAGKVAQILASAKPDELLTPQERQLVKQACQKWLTQHKRRKRIDSLFKTLDIN